MQRWFRWLDQLKAAGEKGVLAPDAVVRDPDRCSVVLCDKGYAIDCRPEGGNSRYVLVAEPPPFKAVSTFPGPVPEVDDRQETLFD